MLRTLLGTLEKDKANAGLGDNDKDHCRTFAEGVFSRADRVDRAGRANKGTALTFLAASFFIDVRLAAPQQIIAACRALPVVHVTFITE